MIRRIAGALLALYLSIGAGMTARTVHTLVTSRSGYAPHYRPGLIEQVARKRGLRESACMVASYDEPIGAWVTVTSRTNGRSERCQVVDTCHPRDCRRLKAKGYVVELGFPAARRLCNVRYYGQEPPRKCPVTVR
jgi:hypothetical protein